jgi:hypothetical protein
MFIVQTTGYFKKQVQAVVLTLSTAFIVVELRPVFIYLLQKQL